MMREEENKNPRKSKTNQFFKKRWVFPAIYLASAAIILTAVLWYQSSTNDLADSKGKIENNTPGTAMNGEDAVPVVNNVEKFSMPVVDADSVKIQKHFYDSEASSEEQEAALVFYNNTYTENTGIDIVSKNGDSFDVVASLSGTVTEVVKDPLLGFVVELDHGKGITTMYSALENVKVEEGATVAQGELLATAGRSLYNEEAGIHAHFEIRKDNEPVNPLDFFDKTLTSLQQEEIKVEESEETSTEEGKVDENTDEQNSTEVEGKTEEGSATEEEGNTSNEGSDEDKAADEEKPEEGEGDAAEDTTDTPDASIGQAKA